MAGWDAANLLRSGVAEEPLAGQPRMGASGLLATRTGTGAPASGELAGRRAGGLGT